MELTSVNLRRWMIIVFALFCLMLNIIAYTLYLQNQRVVQSKDWVSHTYQVLAFEYALFSNLQDMETAERGYLLTGKDRYLDPYVNSDGQVDGNFSNLLNLTSDNPERQVQFRAFQPVIDRHRQALQKQIEDKKSGKIITTEALDANKADMDQVRVFNKKIIDGENSLLVARIGTQKTQQERYVMTMFVSGALSFFGLLIASGFILILTLRRQAAEADLVRINKEMEGFTYIASHDLRSPLVNLKGFSSEMRYGINELRPILANALEHAPEEQRKTVMRILDEDIADALTYIGSSVDKMDKLTNAILELSRIGRRSLKYETVDSNVVVKNIINTLHHQISSRGIEVKQNWMPSVWADPLSIEQVFGNVIDNAIKYLDTSRPGRIEIGGSRNYRETTYWVKDNGRGILTGDMQKIFEIYRRGGNNEQIPGEGMGMAYVRATLRRLSGTIWAESKDRQGTTFYFTISNTLNKDQTND